MQGHEDMDRKLMRLKDILLIVGSIVGVVSVIVGIFVSMYVRPLDARISTHIQKNEPETEQLKVDVTVLKEQYSQILKSLDRIERRLK